MALGGWRVGLVRLADGAAGRRRARRSRARGRDLVGAGGADAGTRPPTCSPSRRRGPSSTSPPAGACTARSRPPPTTWWWRPARRAGRRAAPSTLPRFAAPRGARRSPPQRRRARRPPARAPRSRCWPARRSATTRPRCASAWPPACSTARPTSASSRRCQRRPGGAAVDPARARAAGPGARLARLSALLGPREPDRERAGERRDDERADDKRRALGGIERDLVARRGRRDRRGQPAATATPTPTSRSRVRPAAGPAATVVARAGSTTRRNATASAVHPPAIRNPPRTSDGKCQPSTRTA